MGLSSLTSAVGARLVVVCASRRPTANGSSRAEVARSAVGDVGMRVALAHDVARDVYCAAWRVGMAEVKPRRPREAGGEAWSHVASLIGAQDMHAQSMHMHILMGVLWLRAFEIRSYMSRFGYIC